MGLMETGSETATSPPRTRLGFVDALRVGLVVLVVVHHVALVYGASAPFYYVEPPTADPFAFTALLVFVLVNQSWFMGAFFLLAGYFTPRSFDRKGSSSFLRGRLLRLGVPLVLYTLVLNPAAVTGAFFLADELGPLTRDTFSYTDSIGMGPMWFVAMLLIFSFGYVVWRAMANGRPSASDGSAGLPGIVGVGLFVVALAAASFLIRIWIPIGDEVLGFPTLSYLPQYLSFFVVGVVAYRRNWLRGLSRAVGWGGLAAAVGAAVFLFPWAFSGKMFSLSLSESLGNALGDGQWQSAVYALWDSTFAVGFLLFLLVTLRLVLDTQSSLGEWLARHGYAVYVIHIPIVVYLAVILRSADLDALLKFALVSAIAVPVCFAGAWLVRRIPSVSKIL